MSAKEVHSMRTWKVWSLLIGLTVAALLLAACGGPEAPEPEEEPETEAEAASATVNQLVESPETYEGDTVTVVGQVGDWLEPAVVRLRSCTVLDCRGLLVAGVPEEDVEAALDSDVPVRIVGTVRQLPPDSPLGGIDPADPAYGPFVGGPVIEADAVEILRLDVLASLSNALLRGIEQDPDPFIGREVAVQGGIRSVMTDQVFTLIDPTYATYSNELLIVAPTAELIDTAPTEGAPVGARGTVQWFDADDLAVVLDVSADTFEDYEGEVMIAADSVWIDEEPALPGAPAMSIPRPASVQQELQLLSVIESPSAFLDQWIEVTGEIVRHVGDIGLLISGLGIPIEHELLVLNPYDRAPFDPLNAGRPVLIGGKLVTFVQTRSEELFDMALEDAAFAPFENEAAIVAETIRLVPEAQVRRLRRGVLETIVGAPDQYIGSQIAVYGEVGDLIDAGSFVLTTGFLGDELLILQSGETSDLEEGEGVTVIGTLQMFDRERLAEEGGRPLTDEAFDAYEGDPVLIAERVRPDSEERSP